MVLSSLLGNLAARGAGHEDICLLLVDANIAG